MLEDVRVVVGAGIVLLVREVDVVAVLPILGNILRILLPGANPVQAAGLTMRICLVTPLN